MVKEKKMTNVSGVNISDYESDKASGLISIAKIGNAFVVSIKKFNVKTGNEEEPQVIALDIKQLELNKKNLLAQMSGLEKLIFDLKTL